MKVCDVVVNSVWYDPRVRKQIIEYKKHGIDVCCVGVKCPRYDKEQIALIPCKTNVVCIDEKYDGKQYSIYRKLKREYLRFKAARTAIFEEKPDVIHANDLDALMIAYPVAKKLKCKLVYDSHEVYVDRDQGMQKRPWLMKFFLKSYERYMIHHLEQMVCVSHAAADYFTKLYHIEKPMVVTNCALRSEMATSEPAKSEGFEVLNHGQFYGGRGYDIMVEAAAILRDYSEVKMALRGFGRMEQQLRDRVEELKLSNVVFYPKVKVEELISEASKSMVGIAITEPICLNFKLSISNKLFEYVAAGLPVIMSDIPEHRYLNDQYQFGIVLPQNTPEELAKAVLKLSQERDFYHACRSNALKMREELNWENEFAKLVQAEKMMVSQ